jgi:hypothetical protein
MWRLLTVRERRGSWLLTAAVAAVAVTSCSDGKSDAGPGGTDDPDDEVAGSSAQASGGSESKAASGGTRPRSGPATNGGAGAAGGSQASGGVTSSSAGSHGGGDEASSSNAGMSSAAGAENEPGGGGSGTVIGGQGNAGQAGASEEPAEPPAGATCAACAAGKCSVLASCSDNPECAPWLACLKACDTNACVSACDASFTDVARVYYGVYECLCDECAASCTVAQACSKKCLDDQALAPSAIQPATLAETGLFAAASSSAPGSLPQVAAYVRLYEPKYGLWADGFGKDRYVYVPACATIDTRDMDHWQFPVGTRLWKHFSVGGKLVETRLLHRYGSGAADWLYGTYGWSPDKPNDPTAAVAVLHGQPNANGTQHDIPDPWECGACHGKLPDKPLGFSAIQLSHSGNGLTIQKLSDLGWLTVPARSGFKVPGNPVQQAALGYLHANCGGCHNSAGELPRDDPMKLRLLVTQTSYDETDSVLTTIGVPTLNADPELYGRPRIDPQSAGTSAIYLRMSNRDQYPMPPIATEQPDSAGGVAAVKAWIDSLPTP